MKSLRTISMMLALLVPAPAQTLEVQLRRAVQKEVAGGDLKAAAEEYKRIASRAGANHAIAAQALMHLAAAYEKQGAAEARKTYERIVKDYADQPALVAQARERLAALGGAGAGAKELRLTQVFKGGSVTLWNVSADGRLGGATDYDTGNAAVVDLASGKSRNVTNYGTWNATNGFVDVGAISRDGKQIAFWHYMKGGVDGQLRVASVETGGERTVFGGSKAWGIPSDWSPDGTRISIQLERSTGKPNETAVEFAVVPLSGGAPRILKTAITTSRYRPRILFSPDGRYVAYDYPANGSSQNDVFVVPAAGGEEVAIAPSGGREQLAGWAPDGSLLFISDRTGSKDLYKVAMKDGRQAGQPEMLRGNFTGAPRGITRNGALYFSDGSTLLESFTASVDLGSGKVTALPARVGTRAAGTAIWSPDGKRIASLDRPARYSIPVLLVRSDGSGEEREVPNPSGLFYSFTIGWSADGDSVFLRGVKGSEANGIYRVNATTGEATQVLDMKGMPSLPMPDMSDRGDVVYRGNDLKSILRRDAGGGPEQTIHTSAFPVAFFRISPDGRRLAFVEQSEKPVLKTISTSGGPATEVWRSGGQGWVFPMMRGGIAWSLDGKSLLFIQEKGGRGELWTVPSEGGEARRTELSFTGQAGWLSLHPDGKRITYTISQSGDEYWVMTNFLPPAT